MIIIPQTIQNCPPIPTQSPITPPFGQYSENSQYPFGYPNQGNANHLPSVNLNEQSLIEYNHITYGLYAITLIFTGGLLWIIPVVMNYIKRDEARGTWLYSHFDWQIKTFWYSLFFGVLATILVMIGFMMSFLGIVGTVFGVSQTDLGLFAVSNSFFIGMIGVIIFSVVYLWHIYRLVKGWILLTRRRPVY